MSICSKKMKAKVAVIWRFTLKQLDPNDLLAKRAAEDPPVHEGVLLSVSAARSSLDFIIHMPTISIVGFKILELVQPLRVVWGQTLRLVGTCLWR